MLFNTLANLRVLIGSTPTARPDMLDHMNATCAPRWPRRAPTATPTPWRRVPAAGRLPGADGGAHGPAPARTLDLPDALRDQPVPPLLLQPLVENAIRHGLEPQVDGGDLVVSARQDGDWLWLTVQDSGAGFEPAAPAPGRADSGFGLGQVRERVAGVTGGSGQVRVDSQPGQGTTVRIGLPLEQLRVPVSSTPCPDGQGAPP
jgi:hypothetical protein